MAERQSIPKELERKVLVEAGHRCAIPSCRQTTTDIHHIVPYAKVKEHKFENLIVLCCNCHRRCLTGEIDRKALQMYKQNLGIINSRYIEIEKRLLDQFYDKLYNNKPDDHAIRPGNVNKSLQDNEMALPGGLSLFLRNLILDEIIQVADNSQMYSGGVLTFEIYRITEKGKELIKRLNNAEPIE